MIALLLAMLWWGGASAEVADTLRTKAAKAERTVARRNSTASAPADSLVPGAQRDSSAVGDSTVAKKRVAAKTELALDTTVADSLLKSLATPKRRNMANFRPDPIRSMWLALVFPGAGQIYNRKLWKLPIVYGGFLGCAYALTWNNQMLRDYSQAYLDIMDDDPNTKSYEGMLPLGYDITGKEDRFKTIFKNKKDHFRKYRDMSIFAFAGVYLISVIDAYVDAELSTFDISRDLSIHLEPAVINTGVPTMHDRGQKAYGLSCNINF